MLDPNSVRRLRVTRRQAQILELASQGRTDKAIAQALGLSRATVRTHLQRCYRDNRVQNRSEAAVLWSLGRLSDADP
jgi:DNA-binding CsgD family transcriptional regulator